MVPLGGSGPPEEVNAPYVATVGPGPPAEKYGLQVTPASPPSYRKCVPNQNLLA